MNAIDEKTKFLKNEITAFEGRLSAVKAEVESLRKQKTVLSDEIEAAKERHNKEVESKYVESRAFASSLDEARKKLDADRLEFQGILMQFQKEKNAFVQEKQTILDMKADAQKTMDRVSSFIVTMRNEAQKL